MARVLGVEQGTLRKTPHCMVLYQWTMGLPIISFPGLVRIHTAEEQLSDEASHCHNLLLREWLSDYVDLGVDNPGTGRSGRSVPNQR